MKQKHTFLRRVLSLVLSFAVVFPASLALIGDSGSAYAANKTILNVLAIEPSDGNYLTTAYVRTWSNSTVATNNIRITCVSTLEFNGITEDLAESYDLIYIGHNAAIGTAGNTVAKIDSGYLYANIGSELAIPNSSTSAAVGLTDSEYLSGSVFASSYHKVNSTAQATRYSGNDISPAKLAALESYADAGHAVIISSTLTNTGGHPLYSAVSFAANLAAGTPDFNGVTLTAAATATSGSLPAAFTPTYQWYKDNAQISSGGTSATFTATSNGSYCCKITYTIDGKGYTATSKSVVVTAADPGISGSVTSGTAAISYYGTSYGALTYSASVDTPDSNGMLTATMSYSDTYSYVTNANFTYKWYKNSALISGETGSTYTPTVSGAYYCTASASSAYYYSIPFTLASIITSKSQTATLTKATVADDSSQPGSPATIPALPQTTFSINSSYVDNCSNMYAFLNDINGKTNVMSTASVASSTFLAAANLSTPTVTVSVPPTAYAIAVSGATGTITSLAADAAGTYTLKFTFTIGNVTDTSSGYYCNLYLDSDGNGVFNSSSEKVDTGLTIHTGSYTGTEVTQGTLKSSPSTTYYATYTLPPTTVGIIPWKLEVVKNGDTNAHGSAFGYTHVPFTTAQTINILQINTSNGLILDNTSTAPYASGTLLTTWNTFNSTTSGAFQQVKSDYIIKIQTVTTTDMNAYTATLNKLDSSTYSTLAEFLNSYDLILLGIGGTNYTLNKTVTAALADYLESKPVLFTHDTTSFANVPMAYNPSSTGSNYLGPVPYAYNINNTLRNPFGLDRYGVTDDTLGHSFMSDPSLSSSGIAASNDYPNMTAQQKTALLISDYSIAYLPGSNTFGTGGTPVDTTQGFSDYITNTNASNRILQVNEGQITTFPFDITTGLLTRRTAVTVTIAASHLQPYQLNMNSEDTTVWYSNYSNTTTYFRERDVVNGAYVYKNGNATFSNFGNTIASIAANNIEARLFVNTIITASNASEGNYATPAVKFSNATGEKELTSFLMPTDAHGVLTTGGSADTLRRIYFTVTDTNTRNKTIAAVVSYPVNGVQTAITVPICNSLTGLELGTDDSLVSGVPYYVKIDSLWAALPQDARDAFVADTSGAGLPISVTASATIGSSVLSEKATLTLRKMMLFELG